MNPTETIWQATAEYSFEAPALLGMGEMIDHSFA
jgi:hypothetical protein